MSFWNGTRWVADPAAGPSRGVAQRAADWLATLLMVALVPALLVVMAGSALANNGNHGNGQHNAASAATCVVEGNVVSAAGLPTDEVLNFMVTDAGGTWGWVLGWSDDGTRTVSVPPRTGATTYEFASRTFGNNGSKYDVFAVCTGEA